ncbi:hypothetical protein ACP70R_016205 [Stipagrostis hirtigluma subsp. patula]
MQLAIPVERIVLLQESKHPLQPKVFVEASATPQERNGGEAKKLGGRRNRWIRVAGVEAAILLELHLDAALLNPHGHIASHLPGHTSLKSLCRPPRRPPASILDCAQQREAVAARGLGAGW